MVSDVIHGRRQVFACLMQALKEGHRVDGRQPLDFRAVKYKAGSLLLTRNLCGACVLMHDIGPKHAVIGSYFRRCPGFNMV